MLSTKVYVYINLSFKQAEQCSTVLLLTLCQLNGITARLSYHQNISTQELLPVVLQNKASPLQSAVVLLLWTPGLLWSCSWHKEVILCWKVVVLTHYTCETRFENSGSLSYQVTLVHPSEAVRVLHRLNREQPDRIYFKSQFRSGSVTETTICNVCLHPAQQPVCNYTELLTGEPWFCYKPKNLNCDARINHFTGRFKENIKAIEKQLFQRFVLPMYMSLLLDFRSYKRL